MEVSHPHSTWSISDLQRIQEGIDRIPADLREELDFEMSMFIARMELLEARALGGDDRSRIDYPRVRAEIFEFLKDDLVDFLLKCLSGQAAGFPDLQPIQRNIVRILKELGVFVLHAPGKDLSA
ncbi:MAG: hypothetical protein KDK34_16605, partial [Leptospiraceae bacterium]|nr:hypothetical protein [Leptospiraceae bacterium]